MGIDTIETNIDNIRTKKGALTILREVVDCHRKDHSMEDYRFFEEQMGFARLAADAIKERKYALSQTDQKRVDYARRHFCKII